MINLLPYQRNYIRDISEYEYNVAFVFEIDEQHKLEATKLKEAVVIVVEAQSYLQYVYDNKLKKVVRKSPDELIEINSFTMDAPEEECFNYLNELLSEKSTELHKDQNFHINITICNTPEKQFIFLLLDHFLGDGATMAVFPTHIESTLLYNITMPMQHSEKKLQTIIEEHRSIDLEQLNYWKYTKDDEVQDSPSLNKEHKNVTVRLTPQKTKDLFKKIKSNKLKFDNLMLGAFHHAYANVLNKSSEAIEIIKNMREYFRDPELAMIVGPLILQYPIKLRDKTETIQDACCLVAEQMKEVKGKEMGYAILTSEDKFPKYPSKIQYSNIGSLDRYANASKIFSISKLSTAYLHGDTFDAELPCNNDLFVRPFGMNNELALWFTYNPAKFTKDQITQIMDQTMDGFVQLVEEMSVSEVVSYG